MNILDDEHIRWLASLDIKERTLYDRAFGKAWRGRKGVKESSRIARDIVEATQKKPLTKEQH